MYHVHVHSVPSLSQHYCLNPKIYLAKIYLANINCAQTENNQNVKEKGYILCHARSTNTCEALENFSFHRTIQDVAVYKEECRQEGRIYN